MNKRVVFKIFTLFAFFLLLSSPIYGVTPEKLYQNARNYYSSLRKSPAKQKYRHNWLNCIKKYERVFKKFPHSSRADDALFMTGKLYYRLYIWSSKESDLDSAIDSYRRLINRYPRSRLADDAQFNIAEIYKKKRDYSQAYLEFQKVLENYPRGDMKAKAKAYLKELEGSRKAAIKKSSKVEKKLVLVNGIRHWSNPDYTRIVIDIEGKISYKDHLLKPDPAIKKPPRLYIDLQNAKLSEELKEAIPIYDGLLKMARTGQHSKDSVRIVLDIESIESYKIFPLVNPFRIVIDVRGERKDRKLLPSGKPPASLAKQLGLRVAKIVIDPGHGGKDPGAIGKRGLQEKDVVLKIAKKLEKKLESALGCDVVLTRKDDRFIPLEERTAIANTEKADLFISIHANAHRNRKVCGIETYYLNLATDERVIELAARENATSEKNISDLQMILNDLMLNSKISESSRLAEYVQLSMVKKIDSKYSKINNLGVKQAPFYVLIGAEMPSILIETSFISNESEEKRLREEKYLNLIAEGIFHGIEKYIDEIQVAS
jgi:N-acetylmuramoyl-L-alanine amidase